jgi:hypothetical protein
MNPTSPAMTVLDDVTTWAGITTQPTARGATAILFEGAHHHRLDCVVRPLPHVSSPGETAQPKVRLRPTVWVRTRTGGARTIRQWRNVRPAGDRSMNAPTR